MAGFAFDIGLSNQLYIYGDGVNNTVTIDVTDFVNATMVRPKVAQTVLSVSVSGLSGITAAVTGPNLITFTYTSAIPASNHSVVSLDLGF